MRDDDTTNPARPAAFDAQAAGYDARAGFPPGVGQAIAGAIVRLASVDADDLVVEIGAGTGDIGIHLADVAPGYVGLDSSPGMLEVFHAKAAARTPDLLVADADAAWPLLASSAQVIFASRVIHLLDPDHAAREATRVCRAGGYVMLGRVNRDADSLKERLRRRRQQLLREVGIQPRQGDAGARKVIERLVHAGCTDLGRQSVATWTGEISAAEIFADWDSLSRMGSVEVDDSTRVRILSDLRGWATREFGDLEHAWPYREHYVLDIAQLPEAPARQNG